MSKKITDVDKTVLLMWKENFAEISSLMRRGWLLLADSDWEKGNECFDRVLDIYPQDAAAYTGKLCAALKLNREGELENYKNANNDEYQKALEEQNLMKAERLRLYYDEVYHRT